FTVIKRSRVNDYEKGGNSFNSIEHRIRINDCASTPVNAEMSVEQLTGHVDLSVPLLSKRPRVGRYQRGRNSLGRSQRLMRNNHFQLRAKSLYTIVLSFNMSSFAYSISVGVGTASNDCTPPINRSGPPSDYQYSGSLTIPVNITVLGFGTKNVSRIIQEMAVPNFIAAVWRVTLYGSWRRGLFIVGSILRAF
nr:hypothetical protein [Tanacetum cinerariifolium]